MACSNIIHLCVQFFLILPRGPLFPALSFSKLVPRVLSLPPSGKHPKDPGCGWSRGSQYTFFFWYFPALSTPPVTLWIFPALDRFSTGFIFSCALCVSLSYACFFQLIQYFLVPINSPLLCFLSDFYSLFLLFPEFNVNVYLYNQISGQ